MTEMRLPPSRISASSYTHRYGSWGDVLSLVAGDMG